MSEQDIERLAENYQKAKNEISELTTEISVLKEEMAVMQNQLDWFKRQMFGRKTEQTSVILEGGARLKMQWVNFLQKKLFMNLKIKSATNAVRKWLR